MKLPGAEQAIIDSRKLRDYILSPAHPVGRFKAAFFASLGFGAENWKELESALRCVAAEGDAEVGDRTAWGQKYRIRSILTGPGSRSAAIVSVWIVRERDTVPRFVTVMPWR